MWTLVKADLRSRWLVAAAALALAGILRLMLWVASVRSGVVPMWDGGEAQELGGVVMFWFVMPLIVALLGGSLCRPGLGEWGWVLGRPISRRRIAAARMMSDAAVVVASVGFVLAVIGRFPWKVNPALWAGPLGVLSDVDWSSLFTAFTLVLLYMCAYLGAAIGAARGATALRSGGFALLWLIATLGGTIAIVTGATVLTFAQISGFGTGDTRSMEWIAAAIVLGLGFGAATAVASGISTVRMFWCVAPREVARAVWLRPVLVGHAVLATALGAGAALLLGDLPPLAFRGDHTLRLETVDAEGTPVLTRGQYLFGRDHGPIDSKTLMRGEHFRWPQRDGGVQAFQELAPGEYDVCMLHYPVELRVGIGEARDAERRQWAAARPRDRREAFDCHPVTVTDGPEHQVVRVVIDHP